MAALLFQGAATVAFIYPVLSPEGRLRRKQRWSAAMLNALGVRLDTDLRHVVPGSLLVANHISWLDILVINAAVPSAFVSKDEVRHWPIVGWLAAANDTVFLKRGSRGHAKIINREIGDILMAGKSVAVFPEGTTTDGTHLLHFHAALLQPALAASRPVVPVALSYWESDRTRSLAPRYDGQISLGESFRAVLACRRLIARLASTPALGVEGEDRRAVATAARNAITAAADLPPASNPPEKPVGLPVVEPSDALPTGNQSPGP